MKKYLWIAALLAALALIFAACDNGGGNGGGDDNGTVINIQDVQGVIAPAAGNTPKDEIYETAQYTGTIAWAGDLTDDGKFKTSTDYTATITLKAITGYTLKGVAANYFKVADATTVSNAANSGVITAVFPKTGNSNVSIITIRAIPGITVPAFDTVPVTDINTSQYSGKITWEGSLNAGRFAANTVYTAKISLTAKEGYSLEGLSPTHFTVAGTSSAASFDATKNTVTAVFKATRDGSAMVLTGDDLVFEFSAKSPYGGTAVKNDEGTITIGATGTGNAATGGALLYKFPLEALAGYDKVSVEWEVVDKDKGSGNATDTNGNCQVAFRTYGSNTASYGYGAPAYPDLLKPDTDEEGNPKPLEFYVRGAGTTGGFAWVHNAYQWNTSNRYQKYTIKITSITFTRVPHYKVTFNADNAAADAIPDRDYLENTPISYEGALPSAGKKEGYYFIGWYDGDTQVKASTAVTKAMNVVAKWGEGTFTGLVIDYPEFEVGGGATGNATDGYSLSAGSQIIGYEFPDELGLSKDVVFKFNVSGAAAKVTFKNAKMGYSPDIASGQYVDLPLGETEITKAANLFTSGAVTLQHNGGTYNIKIVSITFKP